MQEKHFGMRCDAPEIGQEKHFGMRCDAPEIGQEKHFGRRGIASKILHSSSFGQAGLENIVILAAIILVGFTTISLLAYFFQYSTDNKIAQSNVYWQSEAKPVAIVSSSMSNDGMLALALENTAPDDVEVVGVKASGTGLKGAYAGSSPIDPGGRSVVYVDMGQNCTPGKLYELSLNFTYRGKEGADYNKVESGTQALVGRCGDYSLKATTIPDKSAMVLGAAITYGGQYDIPVTVKVTVDETTYEPWGNFSTPVESNVNDGQPHAAFVLDSICTGANVSVTARSWVKKSSSYDGKHDSDWQTFLTRSSNVDTTWVKVLRNGDAVPNVPAYDNQSTINDFLRSYIVDGKVSIASNQEIYLFELGTSDINSPAADFQDLVLLVSYGDTCSSPPSGGGNNDSVCGAGGNGVSGKAPNGSPCNYNSDCQCVHCYQHICRQCTSTGHCSSGFSCISYACVKN